jgi:hypothetical protein
VIVCRRRSRAGAPGTSQVVVRFAPPELALVAAAADRDGLAVGAWIGDLPCRVAWGNVDDVPVAWANVVRVLPRDGPSCRRRVIGSTSCWMLQSRDCRRGHEGGAWLTGRGCSRI